MGVTGGLLLPPAAPPCLQSWLAPSLPSSRCPRLHLRLPLHCIQAGRPLPPSKARRPPAADIRSCTQGPTFSQVHRRIHPLPLLFPETARPAPQFSDSHPSTSSLFSASPGCSVSCCSRTSNLVPADHAWARQQPRISSCRISPRLSSLAPHRVPPPLPGFPSHLCFHLPLLHSFAGPPLLLPSSAPTGFLPLRPLLGSLSDKPENPAVALSSIPIPSRRVCPASQPSSSTPSPPLPLIC